MTMCAEVKVKPMYMRNRYNTRNLIHDQSVLQTVTLTEKGKAIPLTNRRGL
jgi:hypothetical protein